MIPRAAVWYNGWSYTGPARHYQIRMKYRLPETAEDGFVVANFFLTRSEAMNYAVCRGAMPEHLRGSDLYSEDITKNLHRWLE